MISMVIKQKEDEINKLNCILIKYLGLLNLVILID